MTVHVHMVRAAGEGGRGELATLLLLAQISFRDLSHKQGLR